MIGGALNSVSWRWIFGLSLPIGSISIILVHLLLRETLKGPQTLSLLVEPETGADSPNTSLVTKIGRVDWIGATLFISSSILILYSLNTGSTSLTTAGWAEPKVVATLISGTCTGLAFLVWEYILGSAAHVNPSIRTWRARVFHIKPMIPLGLFCSYDVCASYLVALIGGMSLFATLYFLSIYFVIVAGLDATKSGLQLLYLAPGLGMSLPELC